VQRIVAPQQFTKIVALFLANTIIEFLPISSTAHGILMGRFLGIGADIKLLLAISQLIIELSLCLHFREILGKIIKKFFFDRKIRIFCYNIALTSLPFLVVGAIFGGIIRKYLYSDRTIAVSLIIGGLFLWLAERYRARKKIFPEKINSLENIDPTIMYKIGAAQIFSILPGVSRSACTIGSALFLGLARETAVNFSFFISIPVGIAGSVFDIFGRILPAAASGGCTVLAVYFMINILFALFFTERMLKFLRTHKLSVLAHYRIVLGGMMLLFYRK
jgi:undecaprenyl-diphosphatase